MVETKSGGVDVVFGISDFRDVSKFAEELKALPNLKDIKIDVTPDPEDEKNQRQGLIFMVAITNLNADDAGDIINFISKSSQNGGIRRPELHSSRQHLQAA